MAEPDGVHWVADRLQAAGIARPTWTERTPPVDVVVDLGPGRVTLEEWEGRHLARRAGRRGTGGGPDAWPRLALTAALAAAGIGRIGPSGDALLPPDVLRGMAAEAAGADGRVLDDGWDEGFAGMLAYAGTKGWIDDDGAVRAHVEWRDA